MTRDVKGVAVFPVWLLQWSLCCAWITPACLWLLKLHDCDTPWIVADVTSLFLCCQHVNIISPTSCDSMTCSVAWKECGS